MTQRGKGWNKKTGKGTKQKEVGVGQGREEESEKCLLLETKEKGRTCKKTEQC